MQYLLNSAVLTTFGTFTYQPLTREQARAWLTTCVCEHSSGQVDGETCRTCRGSGYPWTSTMGYQETATALEELMEFPVGTIPVNRVQIAMEPGDAALVFRLMFPPGSARLDPHDKGRLREHLQAQHWELGLLVRSA